MKLLLGIPSGGAPAQPFLDSLAKLTLPPGITAIEHYVVRGNYVPAQRDLIVARALDRGADVLAMCDDDMVLPPDALVALHAALLHEPRCGLVGALYYSRDGFRPMCVAGWDERNTTSAHVPGFERTPVAVDGVGFGCVMIRMEALRKLAPPYFPANVYIEAAEARVRVCNEDYRFAARLRARGWTVLLHPGVRAGHFDRHSGATYPLAWEPAEVTRNARIAVNEDGAMKLIPARELSAARERHQEAELTYIWPEG